MYFQQAERVCFLLTESNCKSQWIPWAKAVEQILIGNKSEKENISTVYGSAFSSLY